MPPQAKAGRVPPSSFLGRPQFSPPNRVRLPGPRPQQGSTDQEEHWPNAVASVVLAAGDSLRMGRPKPLVRLGKKFFLERVLEAHRQAGLPVCLLLGRHHPQVRQRVDLEGVQVIVNPRPEQGPLSSLWLALEALEDKSALLVHPVDHPLVTPETLAELVQAHQRLPDSILIPEHQGQKGHPVVFPRRQYRNLKKTPLEGGARHLVRSQSASVHRVPVADRGITANLNRPQQVEYWRRRLGMAAEPGPSSDVENSQ